MSKKILAVFDPHTLERVGLITKYTSVIFTKQSKGAGSFELWCDLDDNNAKMVQDGNLIYLSDDKVGIVQYVGEEVDDNGAKSLNVKGKTIKYYMSYRIIMGIYEASNKHVSDIMNELVLKNFIEPTDVNRTFGNLTISAESQHSVGPQITIQKTGGEVMEELDTLAESYSFCYDVLLSEKKKTLEFKAYASVNRTVNQETVTPIVLSTDLKDVLSSKYVRNSQNEKNVALVAGAGEGSTRKTLLVGSMSTSGVDRKEMYVDARDLSITSESDNGETTTLTDEEYNLLLQGRGASKIIEQKVEESFDATVRTAGHTNYAYGVDYFLGDTITAMDNKLGVVVDAEVTEVEEVYSGDSGYSLKITLGYGQPTIMDKLKDVDKEAKTSASSSWVIKDVQDVNNKVNGVDEKVEEVTGQISGLSDQVGGAIEKVDALSDQVDYVALANSLGWKRAGVRSVTYSDLGSVYMTYIASADYVANATYIIKLNNGSIHKVTARAVSRNYYGVKNGVVLVGTDVATATASGVSVDTTTGKKAWVTGASNGYTATNYAPLTISTSNTVIAWYCKIDGTVKDLISSSSVITDTGQYALDAREKNASIEGTLANQISSLKATVDEALDTVRTTVANITSSYNINNLYTFPSDGYIIASSEGSTSGIMRVVICDSKGNPVSYIYHTITGSYQIYSVYVKKGMKAYIKSLSSGAVVIFYGL